MNSLIDRGYRLLNRAVEPAAGTSVRYLRSAFVISDAMPAIISAADIAQVIDGDTTIVGRQLIVRVKRSEMLLDSVPISPKRGDQIEWIYEDWTYVMEVLPDAGRIEAPAVDPRSDWIPASVKIIERRLP